MPISLQVPPTPNLYQKFTSFFSCVCNKKTFPSYNSEWFFWITISSYCKNIFQKVRLNLSNFHCHHNIVSHAFIAQILFHGPQRNEVLVDIIGCIYASVCLPSSSFSHFLYKLLWALVVMMCYYGFKQLFEIFTITSTWSKQQLPCNNCNTTVALKHKNKHMQQHMSGPTHVGGHVPRTREHHFWFWRRECDLFWWKVHSLLEAESEGAEQKMRDCFETLQVDWMFFMITSHQLQCNHPLKLIGPKYF